MAEVYPSKSTSLFLLTWTTRVVAHNPHFQCGPMFGDDMAGEHGVDLLEGLEMEMLGFVRAKATWRRSKG